MLVPLFILRMKERPSVKTLEAGNQVQGSPLSLPSQPFSLLRQAAYSLLMEGLIPNLPWTRQVALGFEASQQAE